MSFHSMTSSLFHRAVGRSFMPVRMPLVSAFHTTSASTQAAVTTPSWTVNSIRTGLIARKKGMTSVWDEEGSRQPVTVLQFENVIVTDIRTQEKHGYSAVQIGSTILKEKHASKPMRVHSEKLGVGLREKIVEFKVSEDAMLSVGTELTASHFVPGQYVDVSAPSIGKGFAGVMKRWNFKGMPASHGVSLTHRSAGSTGQRKWPSKVFKGKKMAGRLGGNSVTVQNLQVVKIDSEQNLVFVKGSVPGFDDQFVKIKDAVKLRGEKLFPKESIPPPFPTANK